MKQVAAAVLAIALIAGMVGCNSNPADRDDFTYRINGAIVVDINLPRTTVTAIVHRDGEPLTTGEISVGGHSLAFDETGFAFDSVYSLVVDSVTPFLGAQLELIVRDGNEFADTLAINVPDTFAITEIIPFNRLVQGATNVSMNWTGAAGSDGYQLAAVHIDSLYRDWGYVTINDPNAGNSGTISSEAFFLSSPIEPDTGIYNLYVYALGSALDSVYASAFLPTPFAQQFADNIAEREIGGLFGSVVVVETDTVRVASQTN
jgi:hypothetical protein